MCAKTREDENFQFPHKAVRHEYNSKSDNNFFKTLKRIRRLAYIMLKVEQIVNVEIPSTFNSYRFTYEPHDRYNHKSI